MAGAKSAFLAARLRGASVKHESWRIRRISGDVVEGGWLIAFHVRVFSNQTFGVKDDGQWRLLSCVPSKIAFESDSRLSLAVERVRLPAGWVICA